ncbi:MAG: hypothetical protein PHS96_13670 [Anaerolineales bacterium]|nr:hypothetical protein [Anaerolineales bacterium]
MGDITLYAVIDDREMGFCKLIVSQETHRILRTHIVSEQAREAEQARFEHHVRVATCSWLGQAAIRARASLTNSSSDISASESSRRLA